MEKVAIKKKKPGRPRKSIKKEVRAAVRFSRHEHFIIKEKSLEAGMKPSAYIRQAAIHGKVLQRLTEEQVFFVRQLAGMSNNINQVAKACQREGVFEAMKYFEGFRQKFDAVLKKMKP